MATIQDLRAWWDRDVGRWAPWDKSVQVKGTAGVPDHQEIHILIFTETNRYSISAREPQMRVVPAEAAAIERREGLKIADIERLMEDRSKFVTLAPDGAVLIQVAESRLDGGYMGCISSSRRWRAGEDWHRGSDLRDGPFTEETWRGILADIVAFELVNVVKGAREPAGTIGSTGEGTATG